MKYRMYYSLITHKVIILFCFQKDRVKAKATIIEAGRNNDIRCENYDTCDMEGLYKII